jgi:hypothetical protein
MPFLGGILATHDASWAGIPILVALVLGIYIWLRIGSETEASARRTKAAADKARQEEVKRLRKENWNLPEEVERRRLEAERSKARQREKKRQREEKWNSPEEVERRRLDAERLQAERAEQERRWKEHAERIAREKWALYHRNRTIDQVDGMSGRDFEWFIKTLIEGRRSKDGRCFKDVFVTPESGDQGGDLTCVTPEGKKAVVQAKRWKGKVGNRAIQEVLGAMAFYKAEIGYVTTNSYFTPAAKALAEKVPGIRLVDRDELRRAISEVFPLELPDFDWDKYNEYVRDWQPRPMLPTPGQNSPPSGAARSYRRKPQRKRRGGHRR